MIEKRIYLVVTFHTTSAAMAMEKRCRENNLEGRLIPVPRSITADCGMAWRAEIIYRAKLEQLACDLDVEGWYELLL